MAVFVVGVCLPILVACIIINMPAVQSNHRRRSDYSDLEKSLLRHHEDNSGYYPDSYGQTERRGQVFDHLLQYEDFACQCRRKYHNKRAATGNTASDEDKKQQPHKIRNQLFDKPFDDQNKMRFEMEVKDAQKISFCNYTVISIPDPRGSRVPKDLENVICKQIGCQRNHVHNYCCIQTYKYIEVSYGDGKTETIKVFVGCACVFRILKTPEELQLPGIDA